MTLLADVVKHKETFYPSAWARYDLAHPGSLRFTPTQDRMAALERDYRNMAVMIFGEPLPFNKMMETLKTLEQEERARPDSPIAPNIGGLETQQGQFPQAPS